MEQAVTHVPDFLPALPEILMAAGAMALLMWGVFRKCDPLILHAACHRAVMWK